MDIFDEIPLLGKLISNFGGINPPPEYEIFKNKINVESINRGINALNMPLKALVM